MANAGNISVNLTLDGAGRFETQVKKASQTLDSMAGSSSRLNKKLGDGADKTTHWTRNFRDFAIVVGLARSAIENLSTVAFALPAAILRQNALIERNTALIEGMSIASMGLADAQRHAKEEVKDLIKLSSQSPYALESVMDSYTKLRVGGIEKTNSSLKALINTASKFGSTSEQLKRGSIAIQQMLGKGVISMEELRQQLGEAIPDIMGIMSRALNVSMRDMVKAISTGTVEAKSAVKLMFNEMYFSSLGASEKMAETWDGLMNQMKNQATVLAKEVGDAGFFSEMKDIVEEIVELMGNGELSATAQNLSDAMSLAARGGFELLKALGENLKVIGAIGTALVASKLFKFGAGVGAQVLSVVALQKQKTRELNTWIETQRQTHHDKITRIDSDAWNRTLRAAEAGRVKSLGDMESYYQRQREVMERSYTRNLQRLNRMNQTANSIITKMKGAGAAMVNAVGGWTNVAMLGVTALIYALDELIFKQQRAAKSINENNGSNANVQLYKDAQTELDRINAAAKAKREEIKALKKQQDQMSEAEKKLASGRAYNVKDRRGEVLQRELDALNDKSQELTTNLERAKDSIKQSAEEFGKSSASKRISDDLRKIAAEYEKAAREIQDKSLETSASIKAQEKVRTQAFQKVQKIVGKESKYWQSEIDKLEKKKVNKFINFTPEDQFQLDKAKGALVGLNEQIKETQDNIKSGTFDSIAGTANKFSKGIRGLSFDLAEIISKNESLKTGVAAQSIEYKVLEGIARGSFGALDKGYKETLIAVAKEIDNQKQLGVEIKKNIKLRQQAEVRLGNNLTQMSKKLGTALAKSNNPFLSWQQSSYQTKELVAQIREQLEKTGELKASHEADLRQLEIYQQQIDAKNIETSLLKEQERLQLAMMTPIERQNHLYRQQKAYLDQLKESLETITDPSKRAELKALIDTVAQTTDAENESKNPFKKWIRTADELEQQVGTKLTETMNGFLDGFIDSMLDSEASFSDIMNNMTKALSKFLIKLALMKALQAAFSGGAASTGTDDAPIGPLISDGNAGGFSPTFSDFATGGVMTPWGEAPLRKYASGGIATSPQVAVFGEGAHNEAYVPLPDGKTIPVTMQGGGAPSTTVNVINQTGTQAEAESSQPYFDGEKYVIDVVMKAAARPGKFRTMMQGRK